jgi:hypothetical protein
MINSYKKKLTRQKWVSVIEGFIYEIWKENAEINFKVLELAHNLLVTMCLTEDQ